MKRGNMRRKQTKEVGGSQFHISVMSLTLLSKQHIRKIVMGITDDSLEESNF